MCAQLDLELIFQKSKKKKEDHLISMHCGMKIFTFKNTSKKYNLMLEHYNLLNSIK